MASRSNFSRSPRHSQLLKRQRSSLVKELPEPAVLLDSPELGAKFSVCDKQEILKGQTQSRRAEKFLDLVELKPPEVFEIFMKLLRTLKPMLADKLEGQFSSAEIEGASGSKYVKMLELNGSGEDERMFPVQKGGGQQVYDDIEEDAGVYGLNGPGPNRNTHHMSCLNYDCREFLASKLNGMKPDRNTFHSFCRAMKVEERMVRVSLNTGNPTAFLIQKLSDEREGTMSRLKRALDKMSMSDVYEELLTKIQ